MRKNMKRQFFFLNFYSFSFTSCSGIGNLSGLWLSCLGHWAFLLPNTLNYFAFQSFDFEHIRLMLFQKCDVYAKLEINVFINPIKFFLSLLF